MVLTAFQVAVVPEHQIEAYINKGACVARGEKGSFGISFPWVALGEADNNRPSSSLYDYRPCQGLLIKKLNGWINIPQQRRLFIKGCALDYLEAFRRKRRELNV